MKWEEMSKELARAFLSYASHKSSCRYYGGFDCDCGLDEFRKIAKALSSQPQKEKSE